MSAAPNTRYRLTRYNVAAKVGSTSLSLVRVNKEISDGRRDDDGSSFTPDATANGRSATDVGANVGSAAAGPTGRNRCGVRATRGVAVSNEDSFRDVFGRARGLECLVQGIHGPNRRAQIEDVLTTPVAQDVKVGADNFDGSQVNPEMLRKAKQVWFSLITNCKGVVFEIVQGADSPSQAWRQLVQHYRASDVKEWRRLALDFYSMNMGLGEHPRQFSCVWIVSS